MSKKEKDNVIQFPNYGMSKPPMDAQEIQDKLLAYKESYSSELSEIIWHQIHLREGIYLYKGALTDFYISEKFNLKYTDLNLLIASKS